MAPCTRNPSHSSRSRVRVSSTRSAKPSISTRIVESIRNKSCPICLNHIENRKAAVIETCMHAYCIDCIRKWSDLKRNCPLCNAKFDRLFFNISVSTGNYSKKRLPDLKERENDEIGHEIGRRSILERFVRRSRDQLHMPLPWRRSFGQTRNQVEFNTRVLHWRANVYKQHLQAVPIHLPLRDFANLRDNDAKERIEKRIQPWIRRELQAILGDSDPSVIVYLASSLWILNMEEKRKNPSRSVCWEGEFIQQLRPFLCDQTDMFWHELRCFAESPFTMETYDSVVEYRRSDSTRN